MRALHLIWDFIRPRLGERRTAFGRMGTLGGFIFFLTALFFIGGLALTLLGIDLQSFDQWLEARGGWFEMAGTIAFRIASALALLVCLLLVGLQLLGRRGSDKPGLGCVTLALIIAYFAWIGMTSTL